MRAVSQRETRETIYYINSTGFCQPVFLGLEGGSKTSSTAAHDYCSCWSRDGAYIFID
jgi:hypothetical protein